ncbi:MAG: hypothetical protein D6772_17650 [Bacteroidetes bacterium]|nr:MAG: hypothetical protein D6772_17650 [Bacteroidota bacterium]
MPEVLTLREKENRRKGQLAGSIMLLLLIILMFVPIFWYQNPPPGQEGIQVNLGIPDIGMGEELNAPMATRTVDPTPEPPQPEPEPEVIPPPAPADPEPVVDEPTVTTEDPQAIALREREKRERAERERQERERQEAEQRERERLEAERRAREEAARATRDQIGGLFNSGGGGGNTNKPGDGGAANGDPDATAIGKKSFGSGTVGGGLGSRGVARSPRLVENSQRSGTVVIELCVDQDGNVIQNSVKFTQRGSTTTDAQLVNAAIRNAKSWGFNRGSVDRQCGTITYNFKVQ